MKIRNNSVFCIFSDSLRYFLQYSHANLNFRQLWTACSHTSASVRAFCHFSGDMTGKESYYTVYAGHEVMYHVSTMLPYSKDNPQQLERKRHIGNDIVNIIYTDDPAAVDSFNPNCIRSQFTRKLTQQYHFYRLK